MHDGSAGEWQQGKDPCVESEGRQDDFCDFWNRKGWQQAGMGYRVTLDSPVSLFNHRFCSPDHGSPSDCTHLDTSHLNTPDFVFIKICVLFPDKLGKMLKTSC